jgi:hypothetical protein
MVSPFSTSPFLSIKIQPLPRFLVRRLASNLYDFTVADQTIQTQAGTG